MLFKLTMESTFFKMRDSEEYFDTIFEALELSSKLYGLGPLSKSIRDSIGRVLTPSWPKCSWACTPVHIWFGIARIARGCIPVAQIGPPRMLTRLCMVEAISARREDIFSLLLMWTQIEGVLEYVQVMLQRGWVSP